MPFLTKTLPTGMLISSLGSAYAQTQISGKIKDGKSHPIPGASITVKNSYDGATSDSSGNYRFSTSDTGKQLLVISSVGYKAIEQPIELHAAAIHLDIAMKELQSELKA